ncbi:hypothetical protein ACFP56_13500 [Paenibacillus septentrionalis]|uniref:General stress protein 17M-like domain-containing protein n=1 Tax=Paenibacillus septentrionalis TaxID=429342 RepID=A0ABW1V7Q5_9BACL
MITKVLLFESEHAAAEGLRRLEGSGVPASQLRVLVSNVEHSRLLNAETAIHIDLLSEITSANHEENDWNASADQGFIVPFFTPQTTPVQVPIGGIPGIVQEDFEQEHAVPSLLEYGLSEELAQRCMIALQAGQCVVCITEDQYDEGIFENLSMGLSDSSQHAAFTGAVEVLNNRE